MKSKLLFFVTEDWYFYSHRLHLASRAVGNGFDVYVLTRVSQFKASIEDQGIHVIPLKIHRGSLNVLLEIRTLWSVWKVYRKLKPDIVHHVAMKPVLYGGTMALFCRKLQVVSLLPGMGSVFSTTKSRGKILRPVVKMLLRWVLNKPNQHVIVQNRDDRQILVDELALPAEKVALIKGSGVDTGRFVFRPEMPGPIRVALVSRLLWDKGIGEYVAAVESLKKQGFAFNAVLVGKPDDANIDSVTQAQLTVWQRSGMLDCAGFVENIAEFWWSHHIAVLPSYYGEGVPKCLIEAAASGRAIVTTDSPGCREIVQHGINGFLVPPRDVAALAEAMKTLIMDAGLRRRMGREGRRIVREAFSDDIVIGQTLEVYEDILCL